MVERDWNHGRVLIVDGDAVWSTSTPWSASTASTPPTGPESSRPRRGRRPLLVAQIVGHAVEHTAFTTPLHPTRPVGWPIAWGAQVDVRTQTRMSRRG